MAIVWTRMGEPALAYNTRIAGTFAPEHHAMTQINRSHRRASLAAIALLVSLPALPSIASPPANPRVGQSYVESTPVRTRSRNYTRTNPTSGAIEKIQETYQEYSDQTRAYQQVGSHPEVRPTTHPVWRKVGERQVPYTATRWVEPRKVYAYGSWDNATQWNRWNTGPRTIGDLMSQRYSRGQDMNRPGARSVESAVYRNWGQSAYPGTVYLFDESGNLIGQCRYSDVLVGSDWGSNGHYYQGGVTRINGVEYNLLAVCLSSPVVLDLDHDGKIAVTGQASGFTRYLNFKTSFVPEGSVEFDLKAIGKAGRFEWLKDGSDGFLVDDRKGLVTKAAQSNGRIDGHALFGGQRYGNGYIKMAMEFDDDVRLASIPQDRPLPAGAGKLTGHELQGLKIWRDQNHDALVQPGELTTLADLGITELGTSYEVLGNDAQARMVSYYIQNGARHLTEDVWFAEDRPGKAGT
ncbi:MAG: hypothetical protein VKP72_02285 [bacterium]|nr:hypothetical protein [bacterium]